MTEETLFEQARLLPLEQQAAFLQRECPDEALRQRVLALLAAAAASGHLLDRAPEYTAAHTPPMEANTDFQPLTEVAGTTIAGRYKLLQQIGEGGMGTVWMAEQTEPVRRKVAVKLIRAERGQSKTILARFEAERQAIALMDHPHIARLLDAGTTESGAPFFVMELVKGIPLNDFCDQHRLTVPERLHLFMQICGAVQHAHQKGIIHRDLKPSNILVESHDGKAVPKVIDFGLAKATTGLELTEQSLFTGFGTVLGTPIYMAPEQATFNAIDIDTRADIYTLGVILYELLTGTTPITRETFKKAALDEVLRLVREQEPVTPSSRVSNSEAAPSVAASRQTEPAKLGRFVRGELDWIVMKALAKERERRYETANGFARDIERFLNHEPVQAGPPTAWYRLSKFVQRNRPQVIAAGFVLAALVVGVIGTTLGLLEARRQEGLALAAAEEERQAKLREAERAEGEKQAKLEAERNLAFAKKGNEILGSVFTGLDPKKIAESGRPLQAILKDNLKKAVVELEGSAIGDPMEVAAMQNTLGVSLMGLDESELAIEILQKARATYLKHRGPKDPDTLLVSTNLAEAYQSHGKVDRAVPLLQDAFQTLRSELGPNHPRTLTSMNNLAGGYTHAGKRKEAEALLEECLKRRRVEFGPIHPETLDSMHNLAAAYWDAGKRDKAQSLFQEAFKGMKAVLGPDHPHTLACMNALGNAHRETGNLWMANSLLSECLTRRKKHLGRDHTATLNTMYNLSLCYGVGASPEKAVLLLNEALQLASDRLPADHPDRLKIMNGLAEMYHLTGKTGEALALFSECLQRRKATLGVDHPETLTSMHNLAEGYQVANRYQESITLHEEALRRRRAILPLNHPDLAASTHNLAMVYFTVQDWEKALPLFKEAIASASAYRGAEHLDTLFLVIHCAEAYRFSGQAEQAIALLEQTYRSARNQQTRLMLGPWLLAAYLEAKLQEKASRHTGELLNEYRRLLFGRGPQLAGPLAQFGLCLLRMNRYADAEALLRESLTLRQKVQPNAWTTFNTQSMLGEALLGRAQSVSDGSEKKLYAEAEPLLLKGYEGMKAREKTIPPQGVTRIPEALDRLIELYRVTRKPDEVRKYRALRDAYPPRTLPLPQVVD